MNSASGFTIIPIGSIISYAGSAESLTSLEAQGWLLCDGRRVATGRYRGLYQVLGSTYGSAVGQYFLPDLRGLFLRGVGSEDLRFDSYRLLLAPGANKRTAQRPGGNTGALVGTIQQDELPAHTHGLPDFPLRGDEPSRHMRDGKQFKPAAFATGGTTAEQPMGKNQGSETRPKNSAVYYLIYAGPE